MKILIAIEDEKFGQAMADFITEHQWPEDTEIRLLHAMEPIYLGEVSGYPTALIASIHEERKRAAKSLLLNIGTQIAKKLPAMPIVEEVQEGSPKHLIVQTAKDWQADLIVMGSHGRSGIGQFLLGSVSMSVLSAAPCSVMVVKLAKESMEETKQEQEIAKKEPAESARH